MTDKVSPEHRSWNMSRIRSRDTAPELTVRSLVHRLGFRFRLHDPSLPGRPDIVLSRFRTVIFIHGCFWHQHAGCVDCSKPTTNSSYWTPKLKRNVERDSRNRALLRNERWKVIVIWECEARRTEALTKKLLRRIKQPISPSIARRLNHV